MNQAPNRREGFLAAGALFLVAVLVRVLHARALSGSLLVQIPVLDARLYDQWAREIASGHLLARAPFFMGPLYAYVLAAGYALAGPGPATALLVQALFGLAALAGAFFLARSLFGPRAALFTLAAGVLYGPLLHAESFILMTPLVCALGVAAAWLSVRAARNGRVRDALFAGIAVGAGGAARADFLVAWPLAAFLLARARPRAWKPVIAAYAAGALLALLPVIVANASRGSGVLLTWNGGWNLFVGNHEGSTGVFAYPPGVDPETDFTGQAYAERLARRALSPAEVSRFYTARALDFIEKRPGRFAALVAERVRLFFTPGEIPQNESYDFMRTRSPVLRFLPVGFGILAPLSLAGLFLARRGKAERWIPAAFAAAPLLTGALFFVTGRFRLPAVPLLLPYAGFALDRALAAAKEKRWRALALGTGGAAAVLLALFLMPRGYDVNSAMALETVHEGLRYEERHELRPAMQDYERAIAIDPEMAAAYHNLAAVLVDLGTPERAIPLYQRAAALDPSSARTHYNLGILLGRMGNEAGAAVELEKAAALQPDWFDALYDLGVAYANAGRAADAERVWRRALAVKPGDAKTLAALEALKSR